MNFLLDCAFGRHDDLVTAVIDKAYVDMAAHTLKGFGDDYMKKWKCRYNATEVIVNGIKSYVSSERDFNAWHRLVVDAIKRQYPSCILSEGQAQKWLNMTIKYIYVLNVILGSDDEKLKDVRDFLDNTSESDYSPPIDSFVLKGAKDEGVNIKGATSWSTFDERKYEKVRELFEDKNKGFLWELEMWSIFANKYKDKNPPCESYAAYVKKKEDSD